MLSENVISEKAFSDHIRSGFLVPDQKSRFLISFLNSIRSGLTCNARSSFVFFLSLNNLGSVSSC